ncbi:MAG: adenylosuccinate lyase, partial [Candidatus Marinimicrobia bacterium]|nr:adenylosuccinate lyase [Candidatus Neomarinimicrobiota bacterium]
QVMLRHKKRWEEAVEGIRYGAISGAVGTYAHIPPKIEAVVCGKLGLNTDPVTTQVIQRDRHAHFMNVLAGIASGIEQISVEIRHLQRTEVHEVEEPFGKKQKGSSAMPHKRNPIITERMTGMARLFRGYVVTALENVALWHERDISHSSAERVIFPDSLHLMDYMLTKMIILIDGLRIFPENIDKNLKLTGGLHHSQKVLLALIESGLTREDAYRKIQTLAMKTWESGIPLEENVINDKDIMKILKKVDVPGLFKDNDFLKNIDSIYERCGVK